MIVSISGSPCSLCHVGVVVLLVMEVHGLFVYDRLQRVVIIGKVWKFISHCSFLSGLSVVVTIFLGLDPRRSSPGRFGRRALFGAGQCAFVVHAEKLDHGLRIPGTVHPSAHPTRVGQRRMHRSPSLGYQLVTYSLGKGQVSEARAVQMP